MSQRPRPSTTTKEYLINSPLPTQTSSYTVISHQFIIDNVLAELDAKGFEVEKELYRCNKEANIATGVYHLKYAGDPELGLMFAWSNSYDKTMRFKCAIGAYVYTSGNQIIAGSMGNFGRKHTGTADQEALDNIKHQINNADVYFDQLVKAKELMKNVTVSPKRAAEVLGVMFFDKKLITAEQAGIIRTEIKKPSFIITGAADSLWVLYNHISFSLQKAHPKLWMDQQRLAHWFLCDEFNIDITATLNIQEEPADIQNEISEEDKRHMNIYDIPGVGETHTEATMTEEFEKQSERELSEDASHMLHSVDNNPEVSISVKEEPIQMAQDDITSIQPTLEEITEQKDKNLREYPVTIADAYPATEESKPEVPEFVVDTPLASLEVEMSNIVNELQVELADNTFELEPKEEIKTEEPAMSFTDAPEGIAEIKTENSSDVFDSKQLNGTKVVLDDVNGLVEAYGLTLSPFGEGQLGVTRPGEDFIIGEFAPTEVDGLYLYKHHAPIFN